LKHDYDAGFVSSLIGQIKSHYNFAYWKGEEKVIMCGN